VNFLSRLLSIARFCYDRCTLNGPKPGDSGPTAISTLEAGQELSTARVSINDGG